MFFNLKYLRRIGPTGRRQQQDQPGRCQRSQRVSAIWKSGVHVICLSSIAGREACQGLKMCAKSGGKSICFVISNQHVLGCVFPAPRMGEPNSGLARRRAIGSPQKTSALPVVISRGSRWKGCRPGRSRGEGLYFKFRFRRDWSNKYIRPKVTIAPVAAQRRAECK